MELVNPIFCQEKAKQLINDLRNVMATKQQPVSDISNNVCPKCSGQLFIGDATDKYILYMCRNCDYKLEDQTIQEIK